MDRPPARPIACQSSSAMTGVRIGQDARERITGTGQASASAPAPSTAAAAMITAWGITSAPATVPSTTPSSIIGQGSARASEQLAQDGGVLHGHPAHEALQHGGAVAGI